MCELFFRIKVIQYQRDTCVNIMKTHRQKVLTACSHTVTGVKQCSKWAVHISLRNRHFYMSLFSLCFFFLHWHLKLLLPLSDIVFFFFWIISFSLFDYTTRVRELLLMFVLMPVTLPVVMYQLACMTAVENPERNGFNGVFW